MNRLEKTWRFDSEAVLGASYLYNGLGHRVGRIEGITAEPVLPTTELTDLNLNPTNQVEDVLDVTKKYYNLLQRTEQGRSTIFTWDQKIISSTSDGSSYHYISDEIGSPIRLLNGAGLEQETYGYKEFGEDIYGNQGSLQPLGYTAYDIDNFSSMLLSPSRTYSPAIGRFTSVDSHWNTENMIYGDSVNFVESSPAIPDLLAIGQSNNLYGYVLNNPLKFIDPSGFCGEDFDDEEWLFRYLSEPSIMWGNFTTGGATTLEQILRHRISEIENNFIPGGVNPPNSGLARRRHNQRNARNLRGAKQKLNTVTRYTRWLPWVAVPIDVSIGVHDNIVNGTTERIVPDAIADIIVTGASAWLSIKAAAAGTAAGGPLVGAGSGTTVGAILYQITDVWDPGGATIRDHTKNGINWLFGNRGDDHDSGQ